jgi:uncharacterized protein (DUF1330 family)
MPAYVVVNVRVKDRVRYEDYKVMAPASIRAHGGRYIARGGRVDVMEGEWQPERLVLLEFPTLEKAKEWWGCDEYAGPKALRQATADTELVIVAGLDVPLE